MPRTRSKSRNSVRTSGKYKKRAKESSSAKLRAKKPARKKKSGNRRLSAEEGLRGRRPERDPSDIRIRNRTILLILVLMLVNGYVFFWRSEGALDSFEMEAAAIGEHHDDESMERIEHACGGDPVDIFFGLSRSLRMESRLSEGRTLRLALLDLGFEGGEIDKVELGIRSTMDLGLLAGSGAGLRIASDREGGVLALELELADGHLIQACREPSGLNVRNIQHPFRMDVAVVSLKIGDDASLQHAVEEIDEHADLAPIIADVLAHHVDFMTESQPGDRIQLLIQKRYLGQHFHRYGDLLAVRYIGVEGRLAFFRHQLEDGKSAFFDAKGKPMQRLLRKSPLAWYPSDSRHRSSLLPKIEFVDGRVGAIFNRVKGSPVVALGAGVVEKKGRHMDHGLSLHLRLKDGRLVVYKNLLRIVGDVVEGEQVTQGQVLALVGSSGKTPRSRLRLELEDQSGTQLDPMHTDTREDSTTLLASSLSQDKLRRFQQDLEPWRAALRSADLH